MALLVDRDVGEIAVGDQDRLCADVVLGLRQQIGRDPVGIAGIALPPAQADESRLAEMLVECRQAMATHWKPKSLNAMHVRASIIERIDASMRGTEG